MIRVLPLVALVGCGRVSFDPRGDSSSTDAACTRGPFSAPVRVMGDVSSATSDDWMPALDATELRLYFYSLRSGMAELYVSERASVADPFGLATVTFATAARDRSPRPTGDELTLFFTSDLTGNDAVYTVTRATRADAFANMTRLVELDTPGDEDHVSVTPDGLSIVLTSTGRGSADLFEATRATVTDAFSTPVALDALNSSSVDSTPAISVDRREIFFVSNRPGGIGLLDVYRATRATVDEPFSSIENVTAVNSVNDEHGVFLSNDGARLYLAYDTEIAGAGTADVWVATRSCL